MTAVTFPPPQRSPLNLFAIRARLWWIDHVLLPLSVHGPDYSLHTFKVDRGPLGSVTGSRIKQHLAKIGIGVALAVAGLALAGIVSLGTHHFAPFGWMAAVSFGTIATLHVRGAIIGTYKPDPLDWLCDSCLTLAWVVPFCAFDASVALAGAWLLGLGVVYYVTYPYATP